MKVSNEMLEEALSVYNVSSGIRYFYYPYNGEIACIPEWYIGRNYPKNMKELEEIAEYWLEKNKRGEFGENYED